MHDEVLVGCAMLLAKPPSGNYDMVGWAARTFRETNAYMQRTFKLPWPGSWKVGGDRDAKPDPGEDAISGYNMGCAALPNRVEHYHHPRMLTRCLEALGTMDAPSRKRKLEAVTVKGAGSR